MRRGSLKPFEFMTRKNSIGIVPTDPPRFFFRSNLARIITCTIPYSAVSSSFAAYYLCGSLPFDHLPRSIDRSMGYAK